MTEEILKKAQNLKSSIWRYEQDVIDLLTIIKDVDNFGSNITFKRNSDGFSRSFGSKKHDFKEKLIELLLILNEQACTNLNKYKKELEEL